MSNKYVLSLVLCVLVITSCMKYIDGPLDLDLSSYPKVELDLNQTNNYQDKIYYNIASRSIVKTSNSLSWHIAFTGNTGFQSPVIQNYAFGVQTWGFTYSDTNWSRVVTINDFNNTKPVYANYYDSFATLFKNDSNFIFYLYFGINYPALKFQMLSKSSVEVKFRYANIDGTNERLITIPLNQNTNYTYFNFSDQQVKDIEPDDKNSWDFEVTRYTTFVTDFGLPQMYLVGGFINNPIKQIQTTQIDNKGLESIAQSQISAFSYSTKLTEIGHDWKIFSSPNQDGSYNLPLRSYIVLVDGKYYGIQFTAYSKIVNSKQVNGFPTFLVREF